MTQEQILDVLKETGVMLEGHFLLTSGKHSDKYMQCARLFQYPKYSKQICEELIKKFADKKIDVVAGPAVGGIIMSYQVSEILGVRNIFAERQEGKMTLRRGFEITPGENALVVEDVVTTGGSVKEVITLLKNMGANIVGVGSVVDRSGATAEFGVDFQAVIAVNFNVFEPGQCELCKNGSVAYKPGSRGIK